MLVRTTTLGGRLLALAALLSLFVGCGRPVAQTTVRGQVMHGNRPVPHGLIVFAADADRGTHTDGGHAITDGEGKYELKDVKLAAGHYRVTFALLPGQGSYVAERFRDPELSGLRADIGGGTEQTLNYTVE